MRELTTLIFCILAFVAVVQESRNGTKRLENTLAAQVNWAGQYR